MGAHKSAFATPAPQAHYPYQPTNNTSMTYQPYAPASAVDMCYAAAQQQQWAPMNGAKSGPHSVYPSSPTRTYYQRNPYSFAAYDEYKVEY
jgi:hypothetical protein